MHPRWPAVVFRNLRSLCRSAGTLDLELPRLRLCEDLVLEEVKEYEKQRLFKPYELLTRPFLPATQRRLRIQHAVRTPAPACSWTVPQDTADTPGCSTPGPDPHVGTGCPSPAPAGVPGFPPGLAGPHGADPVRHGP